MVFLSQPLISTTTSSPSQFLLQNPQPHSSTHVPRTRRFAVVCNATADDHKDNDNPNKTDRPIDRRDVLLGLGSSGLYGTATLLSSNFAPALATPISAPDLTKCSRGTDLNTQKPLDFNCCPPVLSNQIIDYKLPPVTKMRLRPAAHLVDKNYIAKYEKAVELMKALPESDPRSFMQQASVHCAYCNMAYEQKGDPSTKLQIHNSWLFFPWHRWYLYFYERILGKLIGDPTFGLPFWNWDNPPGMVVPDYFKRQGSPLYDEKRNPDNMAANATVDLKYFGTPTSTDPDTLIKSNLAEMYNEMVQNAGNPEDFYGAKYVTGSTEDPGPGSVERGSHTSLHIWVGERSAEGYDMGNFSTAGRESLFFSHHANIDRLWSIRRALASKEKKPKQFNDPELLDANFVFYDENAQLVRVKVGDAFENERMGYAFQDVEIPWLGKRPTPRAVKSDVAAKSDAPKATGNVFPVTLDKVVKVLVDRPKKSRSKKDKEEQQELLVIEGIEVDTSKFVRFDVFVDDEDNKPDEFDKAEYAGCYSQVPHSSSRKVSSKIRLALNDLLEDIKADDDDQILVSLVPRAGGDNITIGGIKIIYAA